MRTFVAIELDKEIKQNLERWIAALKRHQGRIRWVKPEGMHLTLKFLGEIRPESVDNIGSTLIELAGQFPSFPLKFRGTGTFPPKSRRPRVIWVGVEPSPKLLALQIKLEEELERLDFPREKREFRPHLTLGRVKSAQGIQETLTALQFQEITDFGDMQVRAIMFYQSILKPTGAEYRKLTEACLS